MSLDALAQFREDGKEPLKHVEDGYWWTGLMLAVDQSIANSGWAYVRCEEGGFFDVADAGTIKTDPLATGHEDTLRRATVLYREYLSLIHTYGVSLVVHELPPVGNHMARPESSLVSATALRIAASDAKVGIRMVAAQRAKKVITGNGNAKKGEVKQHLLKLHPPLASMKPLNEAIIDAVALAWVAVREAV